MKIILIVTFKGSRCNTDWRGGDSLLLFISLCYPKQLNNHRNWWREQKASHFQRATWNLFRWTVPGKLHKSYSSRKIPTLTPKTGTRQDIHEVGSCSFHHFCIPVLVEKLSKVLTLQQRSLTQALYHDWPINTYLHNINVHLIYLCVYLHVSAVDYR